VHKHCIQRRCIGLNGKFFAFFKWKVNNFWKIYLQYLINYIISIAYYYRLPTCHKLFNSGLVKTSWFAYVISSKTQKLSVQPNILSTVYYIRNSSTKFKGTTIPSCIVEFVIIRLVYLIFKVLMALKCLLYPKRWLPPEILHGLTTQKTTTRRSLVVLALFPSSFTVRKHLHFLYRSQSPTAIIDLIFTDMSFP
jgi:hypothetical protein